MTGRRHRAAARVLTWLRAVAFTVILAVLTAWGVGDHGQLMPVAVVGAAALGLGFLYWLFPRGLHFAFGTATGLAIYATLFVVLGRAQFPLSPEWARAPAFLLPVLAFLGMAWWRRRELVSVVSHHDSHTLEELPHTLGWILATAAIGLVCFALPINRLSPTMQGAALVGAMGLISAIVARSVRDVVLLLVDVALIMEEITERLRHLTVPATAFLLMYALLVIVFAAAYRIADGLSADPLFNQPSGATRITYADALHFSIATLSTVGYGDIHPHDDGIRVLASIQVIAGQLLLLFGVAEILRARRSRPHAEEAETQPERRERHPPNGPETPP
ncbi:potassium channel family protein [Falsiroseomonas oryziterrae]|uniref:potassium channel family protein n=1 Tax=Falsiroseomonas oryziterrae TaxID=2911368 RepID=UPI001F284C60|nr:potassium channel family protein [Roseomonas sp. NPKOSM-4]